MRLGIDIGGTTISLGLVENGNIVKKTTKASFPVESTQKQTFEYLESEIDGIITPEVSSIGIGVPSIVDTEKGIVYDVTNISSWKEAHLKEVINAHYGISVNLNNDSNCFALGAYNSVSSKKPQILLGITLGTGVGVGVICNGKILNGRNTGVGEISCTPYLDSVAEDYCSSKFFKSKGLDAKAAFDMAQQGDATAVSLFDEFADHLGKFITLSLYAYDPDIIVFGGGLANAFGLFKNKLMESLNRNFIYKKSLKNLEVLALPSEDLAIIGASLL